MNRRSFITAGTAVLALSSHRAFGQVINQLSGVNATSELTGAVIDLGKTGFAFHSRYVDSRADVEIMAFSNETCDGAVRFIPNGTDPELFLADRADGIAAQMESSAIVGSDEFDDGGWIALAITDDESIKRGAYLEVQLNAFDGYDLEVFFVSDLETLDDNFDRIQQVHVEGLEPFLFTQESGMPAITFVEGSTSTSGRSGRSTRSSSSQADDTEDTNTRGSETSANQGSGRTASGGDPETAIEAVRDHQSQFNDDLDRFYEIVEMLADETTETEDDGWFDEMLAFMYSWKDYPSIASDLAFPSELSALETAYVDWADGVGQMGISMEEWLFEDAGIDPFLDAIDVAVQLNNALSAELRALGVVIRPGEQGMFSLTHRYGATLNDRMVATTLVSMSRGL